MKQESKKKNRFNLYLYTFIGFFFFLFLVGRFLGFNYRFSMTGGTEPLGWLDSIRQIPVYLLTSIFITGLVIYIDKNHKKSNK